MLYAHGADPARDRPAHVRAASSMAAIRDGFAVIQDDANFVAIIDRSGRVTRTIELPAGPGGLRQFDDLRGNKADKLDLECCVAVPESDGTMLIAFGSGSTAKRERVVVIRRCESDTQHVEVVHLPALYERLRREHTFAGSELNIEGAVYLGGQLRLFGRGNGAALLGLDPANATCDLDWPQLLAHLRSPGTTTPPAPSNVRRYDLGTIDGIAIGFTDATLLDDALIYSATAEDSPDATRDGRVAGSVIGVIPEDGAIRWSILVDPAGVQFAGKVEGIAPVPGSSRQLNAVVDSDDPTTPSELCTVELKGDWR